jgi:hypothetical protein
MPAKTTKLFVVDTNLLFQEDIWIPSQMDLLTLSAK